MRVLTFLLALAAPGAAGALDVRVLVASGPQLTVRLPPPPGPGLTAPLAAPPAPAAPSVPWTVGNRGGKLTLGGQDAGSDVLYVPPSPGSLVEIAGQTYRGGVLLRAVSGGVQGINVVDVEDYLRGVVPAEMPASWPAAALAAQAVIARTYVSARINPALPYDTCATESCQVYRGVPAEKVGTDTAIQATAGQVLAYGDKPAQTYFSSDSGGHTASSEEVWGRGIPYLVAQPDPHSADSPRAKWRVEASAAKVQAAAERFRVRVGTVRSVGVTLTSASGRVLEVTLTGSSGTGRLSGLQAGDFVRALGAHSTRVRLGGSVGPGRPLVLEGSGSGHGVGLSQYGALGMARAKADHRRILGFYYPGTTLELLADAPGERGRPVLAAAGVGHAE
ncbi:stage II sporulation protein D [Deinococcus sp. HSC-46F16]|uniref:SpoIID/LytB domain-containing protein n=1 Tax=Deinococcus sp. HSC-46F16 TaxID=2910968 RepID=UPI00209CE9C1|nr:SpoIID/LytB domain-containing protein [Deinococcus sp. HSC-46F16]MCP2015009.1 stage II sporulation protein D [Deinococcus sp. HSC-46F16]